MRPILLAVLAGALGVSLGAPFGTSLGAQVAFDTPRLVSPFGSGGFGIHWIRAGTLPGDGDAILGTWAMPGLPIGARLRGGVGRGAAGVDATFGGIDVQGRILRGVGDVGFDLDWQGGLGMSAGDWTLLSLPIGLTGGVAWRSRSLSAAPYLTAGLVADFRIGDDAPARTVELSPTLDLGLDLAFDVERNVVIRAALALGDRQAIAVGLAVGMGRIRR